MYYRVEYSPFILVKHIPELKSILYFNANQKKFLPQITKIVDEFGDVELKLKSEDRAVVICHSKSVKNLFVFEGPIETSELIGGLIYTVDPDKINILHIFVHPDCSEGGKWMDQLIPIRLISKLADIYKLKKEFIKIPYKDKVIKISIKATRLFE